MLAIPNPRRETGSTARRGDPLAAPRTAVDLALAARDSADIAWIDPPPTHDGWTLAPDALRFLIALVPLLKPRHILEMGSGLSTRVLAKTAAGLKPRCAISSVDHDPQFGPMAADDFAKQAGVALCRARFQVAPVVARDCGGKILPLYHWNPTRFASKRPPDLVVIDGPPVNVGGREGTLYQVMELARPGTLVLLDDAARASERDAAACWLDTLGAAIEMRPLPGFAKGMAAILVREPVKMADLWRRRADLTRRDLEAAIPPGRRFILIDQQALGLSEVAGRLALPMLEKEGQYWGPPAGDQAAIAELERQFAAGVRHVALAWPAFWWRECYAGFFAHVGTRMRRVLENDRLVVFEIND